MEDEQTGRVTAVTLESMIEQLELRLESERTYGRSVDLSLRELLEAAEEQWPAEPRTSLLLAARVLQLGYAWLARAANRSRALEMTAEFCLLEMRRALPHLDASDAAAMDAVLGAWRSCTLVPRSLMARLILEHAPKDALPILRQRVQSEHMRLGNDMGALITLLQTGTRSEPQSTRDHAQFLAMLLAHDGNVDAATEVLGAENANDHEIMATWGEVLLGAGREAEAGDRMRRAVILAPAAERPGLRERIIEGLLRQGEPEQAADQLMMLLSETSDPLHWNAFGPVFAEQHPAVWTSLRERFPQDAPGAHLRLLMEAEDVEAVIEASEARAFTADMLWAVGEFLAESHPRLAAERYERAIRLQGALAESRREITDFARRLESVLPFFESIGRRTKPRRIVRELLPTARNSSGLRKELERLFNTSFG
ncbi:MAG: hypothetical protein EA398_00820 [Deltaproteobacteria bacterium]|nr:MAG: hypothetical protein EA398_00820 [Deltaproteobacteria bacterium]